MQKWEPIYAHYQNAAKVSEKQDAFINNKDKPGQNRREPKYSFACFPLIFGLFCQFHVPKGSRHLSMAIMKTKTERTFFQVWYLYICIYISLSLYLPRSLFQIHWMFYTVYKGFKYTVVLWKHFIVRMLSNIILPETLPFHTTILKITWDKCIQRNAYINRSNPIKSELWD